MAAVDDYKGLSRNGPVTAAAAVAPSDSTDLTHVTRKLFVGTAGAVKVTMLSGDVVTFTSLPVGWHELCVTRVWATGTTATNMVAGW